MVSPLRAILVLITGALLLSCGSSSSTTALAKPGISTVVITAIDTNTNTNARAKAVAVQSDGKIVAAGYWYDGAKNVFALARYINDGVTDGTLDGSFGTGGIVTTPVGTVDAEAQAMVIQPDGKLVVAGFSYNGSQYVFTLARYINDGVTDGALDASFGSGGIVATPVGSVDDRAFAVAIQSDGKIVVAGYSSVVTGTSIQSRIALARYINDGVTDGALDGSFGAGGMVATTVAVASGASANALAVEPDPNPPNGDLLIVAGVANGVSVTTGSTTTTQDVFLVARYKEDGSADSTFNGGDASNMTGVVTTAVGTVKDQAYAVAIQPSDGNVVVAGSSFVTAQRQMALARYNALDGTLDTTFNKTGTVTTAIDANSTASALAIQPADGKLVAAGTGYNNTYGEFILARFNTDGHLDGTFSSGGKVTTAITYGAEAFGLAIQPADGKPIAAGYSQARGESEQFTLVRYTTAGKVDTTFPPQP